MKLAKITFVASFVALALVLSAAVMPALTASPVSAKGGNPKPTVPADWPASVPYPAGTLLYSSSGFGT